MALKDVTPDNRRFTGSDEVAGQLEPVVRNLLEQIAKIDPAEVAGMIVAVRGKGEDGPNLIGLAGPIDKLMECGVEVIVRIEQLRKRPTDLSKAVDEDDEQ